MESPLKDPLQSCLLRHGLLGRNRHTHIVVAYSGGRDSTALLHGLTQIREASEGRVKLTAAYYWHPWRPLQHDLEIVHQNCKRLGVPWVLLTPNLTIPKTESAAREDRYLQLARFACDSKASAVVTAHHQDDQVETVLFRVLRGTGIDGLSGIPEIRDLVAGPKKTVPLVRPLLTLPRTALEEDIARYQLAFVDDPTNVDTRLKRNFLRHDALPKLEEAFPHLRHSLIQLAQLAQGDLEIVNSKLDDMWRNVFDADDESLSHAFFTHMPHAFQRRVIRRFLALHHVEQGYQKVEETIGFIMGDHRDPHHPALFSLDSDRFLSIYRGKVRVESPQKAEIEPISVSVPGSVSHRTLKMTVKIEALSFEERQKPPNFEALPENEALVDLSGLSAESLVLRSRQPGDKITPLGMKSPIKLKRFLINRGIPRFERDGVPLLASENTVLWAVGVGLSNTIRVKTKPTHRIVVTQH